MLIYVMLQMLCNNIEIILFGWNSFSYPGIINIPKVLVDVYTKMNYITLCFWFVKRTTNDFAPLRCMGWVYLRPDRPADPSRLTAPIFHGKALLPHLPVRWNSVIRMLSAAQKASINAHLTESLASSNVTWPVHIWKSDEGVDVDVTISMKLKPTLGEWKMTIPYHYSDVTTIVMASQVISSSSVCSTVCLG